MAKSAENLEKIAVIVENVDRTTMAALFAAGGLVISNGAVNRLIELFEIDGRYNTNKLLKWLFGKRKMCKKLGMTTTIKLLLDEFEKMIDKKDLKGIYIYNKK